MTELEKAKKAQYDAIDLNKLAEEIRCESEKYMEQSFAEASKGFDNFRNTGLKMHMQPAMNMQIALVAFLMKTHIPEPVISLYAGAFSSVGNILLDMSQNPGRQKMCAKIVEEYLKDCTTVVSAKIPK